MSDMVANWLFGLTVRSNMANKHSECGSVVVLFDTWRWCELQPTTQSHEGIAGVLREKINCTLCPCHFKHWVSQRRHLDIFPF